METTVKQLRIGISGSYGGMNLGDEAILEGILEPDPSNDSGGGYDFF